MTLSRKNGAISSSSVEVVPRTLVLFCHRFEPVSVFHSPNRKNGRNVVDACVDTLRLRPGSEEFEVLQVK